MGDADRHEVFVASLACPRCQTEMTGELSCDRCGWIEYRLEKPSGSISTTASMLDKEQIGIAWEDKANGRQDIVRGNLYLITIGTCLIMGLLASVILTRWQKDVVAADD